MTNLKTVSVNLESEDLEELQQIAKRKGVKISVLIRMVVKEWLQK